MSKLVLGLFVILNVLCAIWNISINEPLNQFIAAMNISSAVFCFYVFTREF